VDRDYSPEDVVSIRGTGIESYPSNASADKAFKLFRELQAQNKATATFGALDAVQVTQMAKYLPTVYVSGWQSSSTASTTNEPGPDLADYPMGTFAFLLATHCYCVRAFACAGTCAKQLTCCFLFIYFSRHGTQQGGAAV